MSNAWLKLDTTNGGAITVRPEAVAAVETPSVGAYQVLVLNSGESYNITPGQVHLECLSNHNAAAGMRVLK
ncbi:MAG TPA: hypothetical protein VNA32_04615 [Actinomycetota bacterium]|nr:hypothetical protein [Actinomycetota bacterium]